MTYSDDEGRAGRRVVKRVLAAVLVVGVVVAVVFGRDFISDLLDRSSQETADRTSVELPPAGVDSTLPSTAERDTVVPAPSATSPGTTTTTPRVTTTTIRPGPTTTSTPGTSTTITTGATIATAVRVEVTTIQVVPPIRDIIVIVNGHDYASDAQGTIALAPADRHGIVEVVGLQTNSPLQQAQFTGWGDGDQQTTRPLDSANGPVVQLGFVLHYRVQAEAGVIPPGQGTITFDSAAGPLTLVVGEPSWVAASRAVASPEGLATETLSYTPTSLIRDDITAVLTGRAFIPAPEVVWRVVP